MSFVFLWYTVYACERSYVLQVLRFVSRVFLWFAVYELSVPGVLKSVSILLFGFTVFGVTLRDSCVFAACAYGPSSPQNGTTLLFCCIYWEHPLSVSSLNILIFNGLLFVVRRDNLLIRAPDL